MGAIAIPLLTLFFLTSIDSPPFFIQKSDVDFLFILPISEKEIVIADSLFTFLTELLLTMSIGILFLFPIISYFSVLVVLLVSVMNAFSFFAFNGKRKIIAYIIIAWMLSSGTMFPFTPFSMIYGYVYGYFILASLAVITLILGIRSASI